MPRTGSLKKALRLAFPHTLPVLTGFLVLGIAYGVLMQAKGYGALWTFLMSALAFCGSMQFVAITLLTTTFDPIQALLMSVMVNARHLFYGIALLDKYKGVGKIKPLLIFWLCDETFSITSSITAPASVAHRDFYFCISLLNYSYWVVGSVLGAVLGNLLVFNTTGLDFALTALFVVLFIEQVSSPQNRWAGLVGMVCTAVGLAIFGAEKFVIPSMLLILAVFLIRRKQCISHPPKRSS